MNRMMIDLETLDTKPTAAVLSVGVVVFNEEGIVVAENFNLNQYMQINYGRTVSKSTLSWWAEQDEEAAKVALTIKDTVNLYHLSKTLRDLWGEFNCKEVWCQGADFDFPILESLLKDTEIGVPWPYHAKRDSRTLRKVLSVPEPEFDGVPHSAVDDATHQALCVIECLKFINQANQQKSEDL